MKSLSILACLLSLGTASISLLDGLPSLGTLQSSAVKGRLLCNGVPAVGVKVKLYDVDRSESSLAFLVFKVIWTI